VREVRLIDEEGKNLGVFETREAQEMAKERELDLIEMSPDAKPPVAKLMDYGKFVYQEKKKAREASKAGKIAQQTELKYTRINLGTSEHDLARKAKKVSEFLEEGHRMKVELFLRGREKYLDRNFLVERLRRILNFLTVDYKIAEAPKKGPRGWSILIEREKSK